MTNATQRELVAKLLAHERAAANDERVAASRVLEKAFAGLAPVVGDLGIIAIFARSAALAKMDCAPLATLVSAADSLDALGTNIRNYFVTVDEAQVTESSVTLCAMFIALMSRLIGQPLTVQLLQRAWPAVDLKESP